jgi:purine-nucleoside phosphorylase
LHAYSLQRDRFSYICASIKKKMETYMDQLRQTARFVRNKYPYPIRAGIILGSGLGNLTSEMDIEVEIPYEEIPHFPVATVTGHEGKLMLGMLCGKRVLAMAGRFHFYEGYHSGQVAFPVRMMKLLGVEDLFISNAAGGLNTSFRVGDLMMIRDHISLFVQNPLIGKNEEELGPRFPDMSEPYSRHLMELAKMAGQKLGIPLKEGIYAGVTGPTFETHAEYRLLHMAGADAVGMSTVQEVITAVHAGLRVLAISVITDMGIREDDSIITHVEVLRAAKEAEPRLTAIFKELLDAL